MIYQLFLFYSDGKKIVNFYLGIIRQYQFSVDFINLFYPDFLFNICSSVFSAVAFKKCDNDGDISLRIIFYKKKLTVDDLLLLLVKCNFFVRKSCGLLHLVVKSRECRKGCKLSRSCGSCHSRMFCRCVMRQIDYVVILSSHAL